MKNASLQQQLADEVLSLIDAQRTLYLASITPDGAPFASFAPYAVGSNSLYVLLSELALHAVNLRENPLASVLIIDDESGTDEIYARVRVNYTVTAARVDRESDDFDKGVGLLAARHGERPLMLAGLGDFHLFRLVPKRGRYIKGFGRAYELSGGTLTGESMAQLRG